MQNKQTSSSPSVNKITENISTRKSNDSKKTASCPIGTILANSFCSFFKTVGHYLTDTSAFGEYSSDDNYPGPMGSSYSQSV